MNSENDNEKAGMPSFPPPKPTTNYVDDLDFFNDFENEFPAIVYSDAQTSKSDLLTEPTLNPQHIDEFNLNDETSMSEYDEEEQNILYFNDLFPFNIIRPDDLKSKKDNDDNDIDIMQSFEDMTLPPRKQRHQFLRYEGLEYSNADIANFEARLARIYKREVHRVPVFDFGGLPYLMAEGLSAKMLMEHRDDQGLGRARRRISWREFILALGLHTDEEMQTTGFTPSYTMIRDPILRMYHILIAYSIAGRIQAPEKVTVTYLFYLRGMDVDSVNIPYLLVRYLRLLTAEILGGLMVIAPKLPILDMAELVRLQIYVQFDDTWAWVAMGQERQPDAMVGAFNVAEDAPAINEGDQAVPAPVQAPQQPPPPPTPATRTTCEEIDDRSGEILHMDDDMYDAVDGCIDQGVGSTSGIRACALRNYDIEVMELENTQNNALAKLSMLKLREYEMWEIRIKQYFQIQDYALWEVIENGNSWVPIPVTTPSETGTSTTTNLLRKEFELLVAAQTGFVRKQTKEDARSRRSTKEDGLRLCDIFVAYELLDILQELQGEGCSNGNSLWEASVLLGRKKGYVIETLKFAAMPFGLTNAPTVSMGVNEPGEKRCCVNVSQQRGSGEKGSYLDVEGIKWVMSQSWHYRKEQTISQYIMTRECYGIVGAGCSQLLPDMKVFKGANPRCILVDFVRWHSPADWMEPPTDDESKEPMVGDSVSSRGHLNNKLGQASKGHNGCTSNGGSNQLDEKITHNSDVHKKDVKNVAPTDKLVPSCFFEHEHVVMNPTSAGMRHHHLHLYIQRISLTVFPAQSVGSSNTDVLDLPCLLVLITGTSQSRQHVDTSLIHIESRKSPTAVLFDDDTGRISIRHFSFKRNPNGPYALSWKPCQGDSLNLPDHRIHKDGDGDASFQLKSDSLPHAHAQTTKTFYKHQDSRIMKAQELKTKTSAQTLIYKIFLQRYQVYQGRLLASFQDDAKYEHVGQDTRSQGGKDDQDRRIKI
ncbi:TraB domain-containing protein [Tanacetum coccineum]